MRQWLLVFLLWSGATSLFAGEAVLSEDAEYEHLMDQYFQLFPVDRAMGEVVDTVANEVPAAMREPFLSSLKGQIDVEALEQKMRIMMAEQMPRKELDALLRFQHELGEEGRERLEGFQQGLSKLLGDEFLRVITQQPLVEPQNSPVETVQPDVGGVEPAGQLQ